MSVLKPKVSQAQRTSQATPFAQDVLQALRAQFAEEGFGNGFGALQREAGTSARQFVNSGGGQFNTSELFSNMEKIHDRKVDEGAQGLREAFAAIGGRFGDGLAKAEGDFRANEAANFGAQIGEIQRQEFASQQDRLLKGIMAMFDMGTQANAPIWGMASSGIIPSDTVVQDSPFSQGLGILKGGLDLFSGLKDLFGNKSPFGGEGGFGPGVDAGYQPPTVHIPGDFAPTPTYTPRAPVNTIEDFKRNRGY